MIKTESELMKMMESVVGKVLANANINKGNLIREAVIIAYTSNSNVVDVRITSNGEILRGIKVQSGASSIYVGSACLILSSDPSNKSRNRAIVF